MLAALGARPQDPVVDIGTGASRLIDALLDRGFRDVPALGICPTGPRRIRERLRPVAPTIQWTVHDLPHRVPSRRYAIWHDRGTRAPACARPGTPGQLGRIRHDCHSVAVAREMQPTSGGELQHFTWIAARRW